MNAEPEDLRAMAEELWFGNDDEFGECPDPKSLPDTLLPVEPFDMGLLPAPLKAWVADISERMQCPADFVAVAAMVAASTCVGRRAAIKPKRRDDWIVYATVWALVIALPGMLKSPALNAAVAPLKRLEADANKEYESAKEEHALLSEAAELKKKHGAANAKKLAKGGSITDIAEALRAAQCDAPEPPNLRRYTTGNATPEALLELCITNPQGVAIIRDEIAGMLQSLSKEGNEELRSLLLQGYDGNAGYSLDRIGRGYRRAESVWISMLGSIQPGVLRQYLAPAVNGGATDDGLIQRFGLAIWPDPNPEWVNHDRYPLKAAKDQAWEVFQRLANFSEAIDDDGLPAVHTLRFDDAAQLRFDEWRAALEIELRSDDVLPVMASHLGKYRKLCPTMALLSALIDGEREFVRDHHAAQGIAWCRYLRTHAERIYHAASRSEVDTAKLILNRIRKGDLPGQFKAREIHRRGWSGLKNAKEVNAALEILEVHDFVKPIESSGPGRPTITYRVNPKVKGDK